MFTAVAATVQLSTKRFTASSADYLGQRFVNSVRRPDTPGRRTDNRPSRRSRRSDSSHFYERLKFIWKFYFIFFRLTGSIL